MPFSIDIPAAIRSGKEFPITLDEESGDVVEVKLTLKVGKEARKFRLRVGGKTLPKKLAHKVDVGGPRGVHIVDWGEAPSGTPVAAIAMSNAAELSIDLGTVF
jgi:hypothetical protein